MSAVIPVQPQHLLEMNFRATHSADLNSTVLRELEPEQPCGPEWAERRCVQLPTERKGPLTSLVPVLVGCGSAAVAVH
jgi:hypothetical protein